MADYAKNWDKYYRRTYHFLQNKSLWEVNPSEAVAVDQKHFGTYLTTDLPIIDIGCGTGEQAVFLRQHYPKVLGVDVAKEAIKIAQERYQTVDVTFDTLDISDVSKAREIAAELGPSNIYIRGVLHQTLEEDREDILTVLQLLMGAKGRLYLIEVADNIRQHLQEQVPSFTQLPDSMRRALVSNLPPKGLSEEHLTDWFPSDQFQLLKAGSGFLATNLELPDGDMLQVPAIFAVVQINRQ